MLSMHSEVLVLGVQVGQGPEPNLPHTLYPAVCTAGEFKFLLSTFNEEGT